MEKYNYLIEWSGDNYEKKGGAPFFFYCKEKTLRFTSQAIMKMIAL